MNLELRGVTIADLTGEEVEDIRRQLAIPDSEIEGEVKAREEKANEEALIDAAEVARRLGVSREYVYDHAAELGAERLGTGPRARLRFDPVNLGRSSPPAVPERHPRTPRHCGSRPSGELLAVRGEAP